MEFVTITSSKMPPESLSIAGGLQIKGHYKRKR
jgi:hypothetical protein